MSEENKTLEALTYPEIQKIYRAKENELAAKYYSPKADQEQEFLWRDALGKICGIHLAKEKLFYTKEQIDGLVAEIKELEKTSKKAGYIELERVLKVLGAKTQEAKRQ